MSTADPLGAQKMLHPYFVREVLLSLRQQELFVAVAFASRCRWVIAYYLGAVTLPVGDPKGRRRAKRICRSIELQLFSMMAVLFALAMLVDVLKALSKPLPPGYTVAGLQMPPTGIVVLGVRHAGAGAGILALLVAAVLFLYAVGIWRMKRYALTIAWLYAAYVILNATLFTIRNPAPPTPGAVIFAIVYLVVATILTLSTGDRTYATSWGPS
jgi:hypothetical protein